MVYLEVQKGLFELFELFESLLRWSETRCWMRNQAGVVKGVREEG
jgi:hypothetical protein